MALRRFPFKPEGEPASIQAVEPPEGKHPDSYRRERADLRTRSDPARRGIALTWLFHLIGDIHRPLHAAQLFSREYPKGDRGGIEMCVRVSLNAAPIELHRLWDAVITSSGNINRLRNTASDLLRQFSGSVFRELDHPDPEAWAKENYGIATKIAYENKACAARQRGQRAIVGRLTQ